jgi:predicted nucleic acid-binding protein
MGNISAYLDTDVLLNWLCEEANGRTGAKLWKAPLEIIKASENKNIAGCTSLLNLIEIRFVLRRKKKWTEKEIETTISKIHSIIAVIIPNTDDIISAYSLQGECNLDPFDAIYLAISKEKCDKLITRDATFINLANEIKPDFALTPEEFVEHYTH